MGLNVTAPLAIFGTLETFSATFSFWNHTIPTLYAYNKFVNLKYFTLALTTNQVRQLIGQEVQIIRSSGSSFPPVPMGIAYLLDPSSEASSFTFSTTQATDSSITVSNFTVT